MLETSEAKMQKNEKYNNSSKNVKPASKNAVSFDEFTLKHIFSTNGFQKGAKFNISIDDVAN